MISVNQRAAAIVQRMLVEHELLGLSITRMKSGATLLDAGVKAPAALRQEGYWQRPALGDWAKSILPGRASIIKHPDQIHAFGCPSGGDCQFPAYRLYGFPIRGLGGQTGRL